MKNINHRQHFWESTTVNNKSYTNPENSNTGNKESNEKGPIKGSTHHVLSKKKKNNQTASAEITTEVSSARENPCLNWRTVRGEELSGEKKKSNKKVKNETFNSRVTADKRRNNAKGDTPVPLKKSGEGEKLLEKRECLLNRESTKFHEKTDIENDASDFSNLITFDDQPTVSENIPIQNNPPHGTHRDALRRDDLEISLKNVHFDIHLDDRAGIGGIHTETVPEGCAARNGTRGGNRGGNRDGSRDRSRDGSRGSSRDSSRDGSRDGSRKTKHGPSGNGGVGKNPHNGTNTAKAHFAKLNKEEKDEKELLLEHIKRLEYQNNIFLNNLLNVYYVCMDYIKMQDEKIKKNEEIILFQNKIIKDLKASEHLEDTTVKRRIMTLLVFFLIDEAVHPFFALFV
ncbi:hypothetical protein PCYB_112620 [Plasmodium cynomolgi strain B]|uniref:Uncharacterized protein n=1 Tax=Plasmodium cynomolgi (strain B) TaxID=1120755 RepID=K6UDV1_PLACD|nr:hypothetical protein PCYB_112620 [Plasmodium cynomolgi strain B]GAB67241.1 hypothetical protein PCYB_112620 [Plasmodium cynomolgi strain B]